MMVASSDVMTNSTIDNISSYYKFIQPLLELFGDEGYDAFKKLFEDENINDLALLAMFMCIVHTYPKYVRQDIEEIDEHIIEIIKKAFEEAESWIIESCINIITILNRNSEKSGKATQEIIFELMKHIGDFDNSNAALSVIISYTDIISSDTSLLNLDEVIGLMESYTESQLFQENPQIMYCLINNILLLVRAVDIAKLNDIIQWTIEQDVEDITLKFQLIEELYRIDKTNFQDAFNEISKELIEYIDSNSLLSAPEIATSLFEILNMHVRALKQNSNIIEIYEAIIRSFETQKNITQDYLTQYLDSMKHLIDAMIHYLNVLFPETLIPLIVQYRDEIQLDYCSQYFEIETFNECTMNTVGTCLEGMSIEGATTNQIHTFTLLLSHSVNQNSLEPLGTIFEKYPLIGKSDTFDLFCSIINQMILNGAQVDAETICGIIEYGVENFEKSVYDEDEFMELITLCIRYKFIPDPIIERIINEVYTLNDGEKDEVTIMNSIIPLNTIIETREDIRNDCIGILLDRIRIAKELTTATEEFNIFLAESMLIIHVFSPGYIPTEEVIQLLNTLKRGILYNKRTITTVVFPSILQEGDTECKNAIIEILAEHCILPKPERRCSYESFSQDILDEILKLLHSCYEANPDYVKAILAEKKAIIMTFIDNFPSVATA
jgi:hypothetical protein